MEKIEHNIEYEEKIVNLFGCNIIGPDNSNRWTIVDEDNNKVGFIQYKKWYGGKKKKGLPKEFAYFIEINQNNSFDHIRKVHDTNETYFNYIMKLDKENCSDNELAEICLNEYPSLEIWSEKYGHMSFHVYDDTGLYLNFKSKTDNFNVEETVTFKPDKEYSYELCYCKNDKELDDSNLKGSTIRQLSGKYNPICKSDGLILEDRTWVNGKMRTNKKYKVEGTVEEMVNKHQMGIDAFNHFRFLINQILPFEKDIISEMLSDKLIEEKGLSVFVPDIVEERENKSTKK